MYYIGMHSTFNLDDGYLGSGKILGHSIEKYGKESHAKEILEYLESRELLTIRERELVNEQIIKDPKSMNIVLGGNNFPIIDRRDPKMRRSISEGLKAYYAGPTGKKHFQGRKHSEETLQLMREIKTGKRHTEESKNLISKKNKGNTPVNRTKIVVEGVEYESLHQATLQSGINMSTIRHRTRSTSEKFKDTYYVN